MFYEPCGSLISPGDILDKLPPVKLPVNLRIARKWAYNLPPRKYRLNGELHEVLDIGKHLSQQESQLESGGEQLLIGAKGGRAIFLTWGSEVEDDERSGKVDKKDWLIAPVVRITPDLASHKVAGANEDMAGAIRANKSPHFFYLPGIPGDESGECYVDFRKLCPVAATHIRKINREWRLAPTSLNDLYHQLIWFFTRKEIFFRPLTCTSCGADVNPNIVFEGQPVDPPEQAE